MFKASQGIDNIAFKQYEDQTDILYVVLTMFSCILFPVIGIIKHIKFKHYTISYRTIYLHSHQRQTISNQTQSRYKR